jgi:iron complex outermembrane receptor protein
VRLKSLLAATAMGVGLAPAALAQPSAQPAASANTPNTLSEIIVTARKRQESILNVPVVETAIPAQQLERIQFTELKDLNSRVPGLILGESNLSIGTQVSLRGVGTNTLNAGEDQSVALNVDGMQLTQGLAYSAAMFDIGQVEVLRGPQALFYGKNSPGGVISVRTADPTETFELIGRYGHEFEARENRAELIVSGPVNDQLRLRLAAEWDQSDGYFKDLAVAIPGLGGQNPLNRREPNDKNYVVRGTAIWKPADTFDARIKYTVQHGFQQESGMEQMVSCPAGVGPVPGFGVPFLGNGEDCKPDRNVYVLDMDPRAFPGIVNHGVTFLNSDQNIGTVELNYRPRPDLTITSDTGYYHSQFSSLINASFSSAAGAGIAAENWFSRRDITEELRANSDFAGALNFTVGGFFQDADVKNRTTLPSNIFLGLPPELTDGTQHMRIRAYSGFGQVRYKPVAPLEIALGARYSYEKRTDEVVTIFSLSSPVGPTPIATPEIRSYNLSPELTITYKPQDNITVFGSLKKGFKSGSYDITDSVFPNEEISFGDEKVKGGEVGVKTRWLDRRLSANLAFYDYRYEGLQVGVSTSVPGVVAPQVRTENAGASLIYGIDFDTSYHPEAVDGLELHAALEWNKARFKQLDIPCWGDQSIAQGCNLDFNPNQNGPGLGGFSSASMAGYPLLRAPDWQVSGGFSYERPVGHDMSIIFANDNQYSSKYLTVLGTNRPDFYQPAFFKADVSLTLKGPHDRWELAFIGNNVTDRLTKDNCSAFNFKNSIFGGQSTGTTAGGPAGPDASACFLSRGRELWVRVTYKPFS